MGAETRKQSEGLRPEEKVAYHTVMNVLSDQFQEDQEAEKAVHEFSKIQSDPSYSLPTLQEDDSFEPRGFLGKYSQKLEDQTKRLVEQHLQSQAEKQQIEEQEKEVIPYSENAPKHKGILARIAEREHEE